MAFPQVQSITESVFSTASTTHNVSMPATVNSGDLLLIFFSPRGDPAVTNPSGWALIGKDSISAFDSATLAIYAKSADGTEGGGTVEITIDASRQAVAQVYRITGWGGDASTDIDISTSNSGLSSTVNYPSLTIGWGVADTLWIASVGYGNEAPAINGYPTNYTNGTNTLSVGTTSERAGLATSRRELATETEDPSDSTFPQTEGWVAFAIAIEPGTTGGGGATGTNFQINIGDAWKTVDAIQINIGDAWKSVDGAQINIGDAWKTIF